MRTQSPDTSPAAERKLVEMIRQASLSRKFHLVQSLSQRMLSGRIPELDRHTEVIRSIATGYNQQIAQRVATALAVRPDWQEQSVDLTATLFPVMQALQANGYSSYIGGSIASSLHGMQQSAIDIDLVLIQPTQGVATALASLGEQYLVEHEVLTQFPYEKTAITLIHIPTLMKMDVIFPRSPGFDEEMQAFVTPQLIDERYEPLPLASASEMIIWKLARCATEQAHRSDGMINDAEWNDILGMMKVQEAKLDLGRLRYWAQAMHVDHLLTQALDDAGIVVTGTKASNHRHTSEQGEKDARLFQRHR